MSNDKWLITTRYMAETSILLVTVLSPMTWDDYHALVESMFHKADENKGNVDIVWDTGNYSLPSQTPLHHFRRTGTLWNKHPNVKSIVIVLQLPFLVEPFARMASNFVRVAGIFEYAKSVEEAVLKIQMRYQASKDN